MCSTIPKPYYIPMTIMTLTHNDKARITSIYYCTFGGMQIGGDGVSLDPGHHAPTVGTRLAILATTTSRDAKSAGTTHDPANQQKLLHPEIYNVTRLRREKSHRPTIRLKKTKNGTYPRKGTCHNQDE